MIDVNSVTISPHQVMHGSNSILLSIESIFAKWSQITRFAIDQFYVLTEEVDEFFIPIAARLEQVKSARHIIEELAQLKENWDGYGAPAISQQACGNAYHFMDLIEAAPYGVPIPEISPTSTGTISLEWEAPHAEAYIEIGNTRYSGFISTDQKQSVFFEGYADLMDQQIVALVQRAMSLAPSQPASITEIQIQTPKHEYLVI